jgi:alkylated DNA repair protein alkB family protein 6
MKSLNPKNKIPPCLEDVKIMSLPSSAYYIADFISEEEEQAILKKVCRVLCLLCLLSLLTYYKLESSPKPKWKQLSKRRLQTWPSDLNKNVLFDAPLPQWLMDPVVPRLTSWPVSSDGKQHIFQNSPHGAPNHVLINEYLPGQGIMPHKDGAAYHSVVSTVSLGASLCLNIFSSNEDGTTESSPRWRILQEPRSLLITTGELYTDYLHGIAEITEDENLGPTTISNWELLRSTDDISNGILKRQTRISLTYRDVIKVSKLGTKFAMFSKR